LKVVILAGGFGTRISEESHLIPKPMVEIGGVPILIHIMRYYSSFGFNEFIILAGYKQKVIKEYFNNYFLYSSNVTFDYSKGNRQIIHNSVSEEWKVTVVDTGLETMTGGRIKLAKKYIGESDFMLTYGDGVSNVDLNELILQHNQSNNIVTLTAVKDLPRFGILKIDGNRITEFKEKDVSDSSWINGGFMVIKPEIYDLITTSDTVFEKDTLRQLSRLNKLGVYKHTGFWQCMDTLRDKELLEDMFNSGEAQWLVR
jgi:glucose-1-phosphate cytidylyltransferase